jgi:Ca2+-binding EF-hand superfamily protein
VAGLVATEVVLPNSTRPRWVACLGDEERLDEINVVHLYPALKPRLAMNMKFKIANCQLFVPKRPALEDIMIKTVSKVNPKADKINILQRVLKVGLHNGHTVISGHWHSEKLKEDRDDDEILLTDNAVINLYGYVPDPYMALVFVIEYQIGVTVTESAQHDSKSLIASMSKRGDQETVTTSVLGTAVYIPYDGKRIRTTNKTTEKSSDDVDIEIKVLKDETCEILSSFPVIHDTVAGGSHSTASNLIMSTVTEENPDASAQDKLKNRLSYVRESKSALTIPKKDKNKNTRPDFDNEPMLGFDLRITHPIRGDIRNDENVESLTKIEETMDQQTSAVKSDDEEDRFVKKDNSVDVEERDKRKHVKAPKISSSDRKRYDDDSVSVVDSIVSADERGRSFLNLGRNYYDEEQRKQRRYSPDRYTEEHEHERESDADVSPVQHSHFSSEPREKSQLFSQALNAKIRNEATSSDFRGRQRGELLPYPSAGVEGGRLAAKTLISLKGNEHFYRDLTRGTKSKLYRYGVQDSVMDSAHNMQARRDMPAFTMKNRLPYGNKHPPVDLELEMYDDFCIHEINIQFAGFRPRMIGHEEGVKGIPMVTPGALYFSYQFYTCAPTRTESHRVLPAQPGEVHVLVRDEPTAGRDDTPLTMRYIVDCSQSSPHEAIEFVEYLANKSLYVDVWDSYAVMYLGTMGIPLRMLMRQNNPMVKNAIECDVINGELSAMNEGGVTVMTITENGPVVGETIGSVSLVVTNYGREGKGPNKPVKGSSFTNKPTVPIEGLNWRAHGIDDDRNKVSMQQSQRPKNIVRAKPLTATAPDLSKALVDLRQYSNHSPRSLASNRNFKGTQTLNYDEVLIIYRRFEGNLRGTVQYAGPLLILMDLPSYPIVLRKFIKAFKSYNDITFFKEELLRFANSAEEMKIHDIEEMIKVVFEKTGIKAKQEERVLLSQKIAEICSVDTNYNSKDYFKVKRVLDFVSEESDRSNWLLVNKRLQLCVQKAELDGVDVEQMLAEYDIRGIHSISVNKFRDFLTKLSLYGKLATSDIQLCCRYFSKTMRGYKKEATTARYGEEKKDILSDEENDNQNVIAPSSSSLNNNKNNNNGQSSKLIGDEVSLHEVMAVLGKAYIGNIQFRLQKYVKDENFELKYILRLLTNNGNAANLSSDGFYSYDEIENLFRSLHVFANVLNRQQFEQICSKLDVKKLKKISLVSLLNYLGIPFKASDLPGSATTTMKSPRGERKRQELSIETAGFEGPLTTEFLLNLLLTKVRENGVAVDSAFRHFDLDGDGSLTASELERGLLELEIFNSIPNWKQQVPNIVKKFDKNGDGTVSLREFFRYLGINDYSPNIIQRLTKIFVIAVENNSNQISLKEIFSEFDDDKNGTLDANELFLALTQKLSGSFQDVTMEDCQTLVNQFDNNGDGKIAIDEFCNYFNSKIKEGIQLRKMKRLEMTKQRFRDVMLKAKEKGGITLEQIFNHLNKNGNGEVSLTDLLKSLKEGLPNLNKNENDLKELLSAMDSDGSGSIDLNEFKCFINEGTEEISNSASFRTIYDQVRETFGAAYSKGLSFEQFFNVIDKDLSGTLSITELEKLLRRISSFSTMKSEEIRTLFDMIDEDHSGLISLKEFKSFVSQGKQEFIQDKKLQEQIKRSRDENEFEEEGKSSSPRNEIKNEKLEPLKDKLLRHLRKIAEYNGGIRNVFANLDYDGDGLILFHSFVKFLKSEDFFDMFTLEQVEVVLDSFFTKDKERLYVIPLIQWLTGETNGPNAKERKIMIQNELDNRDEGKSNEDFPHYNFSTNPEVKSVERKLRSFGQTLSSKGVDVESKFQFYDIQKSGSISRSDFLKVLSELGIYLLEEGKVLSQPGVFESNINDENFIKNLQKKQISLLKGGAGNDYISNAPKLARKLFNQDISNKNNSEFKNHIESLTLIDWYRQGQKQMLLQHVLSHSLAHTMHLYPR